MHMSLSSDCCYYLEGFIIGRCTTYNAYHTHHHASADPRDSDRIGVGPCLTGLEKCLTSLCDKFTEYGEEQERRSYLGFTAFHLVACLMLLVSLDTLATSRIDC